MVFSELYSGLDTTSIGAMHRMGVEASYYNVQYISSKEEGFSETFFRTKISQYTVYYILLYPSWIDKFIATKKGRIKPTFSLFLRCLLIKLQVRNIHRRRHEKFSYISGIFFSLNIVQITRKSAISFCLFYHFPKSLSLKTILE